MDCGRRPHLPISSSAVAVLSAALVEIVAAVDRTERSAERIVFLELIENVRTTVDCTVSLQTVRK